jgi:hypothetical protein
LREAGFQPDRHAWILGGAGLPALHFADAWLAKVLAPSKASTRFLDYADRFHDPLRSK